MVQPAAYAPEVLVPPGVVVTAGHERELLEHLAARPRVVGALRLAVRRLHEAFPDAKLVLGLYRDPEEDWAYPLLVLAPGGVASHPVDRLDEAAKRVAVEILGQVLAGTDDWFHVTVVPVWPEARS